MEKERNLLALAGLIVLGMGAYFTVMSTEKLVSAIGISKLIGGLFITAPMAALPEAFATYSVARSGQVTSSVTSVIGDHAVTLTVAFLPLALTTVPVKKLPLFFVNLIFVALVAILYAAFIHWGRKNGEHGFMRWQVFVMAGTLY